MTLVHSKTALDMQVREYCIEEDDATQPTRF